MNKKILLCLTAAAMLTACAKSSELPEESGGEILPLYRSEQTLSQSEVSGELQGYSYSPVSDRLYYLSCNMEYTDESGKADYYLGSISSDGTEQSPVLLASGNISLTCPDFTAEGKGYYILSEYSGDEEKHFLKEIDMNGNEQSSVSLENIPSELKESGFYPREIIAAPDGIYVSCYDMIAVFGYDGSFIKNVTDSNMNVWTMVRGASGSIYAWGWGGDGFELKKIDITSSEPVSAVALPFDSLYDQNAFPINGFGETELFMSDGVSLFALDLSAGTKETVLDWIDSGVSVMEISKVFPGEKGFLCGGKAYPSEKPCVYNVYLTDEKPAEKTELVLTGDEYSLDPYIKNQAVTFNRQSGEYKVTLRTYAYDDTQALNMDMLSGKAPDILMIGSGTPSDVYASKGLFADMYELIDSDPELSRKDFLPNLLKACENDGKLYTFTDRFKLFTVLGKTSIFGDKSGITVQELKNIAAGRPEGTEIFPGSCKNDILDYALCMSGDRFIDMEKGTCDFTSEYFINILEYANEYMSSVDLDTYFDDSFWSRYQTMYSDESSLLLISYLTDYGDIYALEHENFGEPVTAVGFPCDSGSGSSFSIETGFAVTSSDKKEGAWQFVRTLLLPEYQDYTDSFSVRTDSQEKKAKQAMAHKSDRVYDPIVMMGQMMLSSGAYDIGEPSEKDIEKINDIIASAEGVNKYNSTVRDIITEEADRYFSGVITSEEAAQAIRSRVQIYLSESC